ncbi:MAG: FKBP-type peptidyl-prolyl cis-trans isomerase [Acidobacteria bacterium]|nr:FKBP-type peptidyl-prolyl cis-trans isomerase [Acidobacteriota bacterium]
MVHAPEGASGGGACAQTARGTRHSAASANRTAATDLRVGTGVEAVAGRTLTVHYTGWLYAPTQPDQKGQQFDSSAGRAPFSFVLGAGRVIQGWERGVPGMRVGGLRRLVIPPELGYGAQGAPGIPPNSTLVFDVELLDVQ